MGRRCARDARDFPQNSVPGRLPYYDSTRSPECKEKKVEIGFEVVDEGNAEKINGTISDDSQLSVMDENINNLSLTNGPNTDDFRGTEVDSKLESSNAIYFDASAKSRI